jgi:glutamate 5-kinase
LVEAITPEIEAMAGDAGSGLSKGGMKTKLMAARTATAAGCAMAITEGGRMLRPLKALGGWRASDMVRGQARPAGGAQGVDRGDEAAGRACGSMPARWRAGRGKSLLPAGVTRMSTGTFQRGDPVTLQGPDGAALGLGLSRYTATEARAIAGHRSDEIEAILGYPGARRWFIATTWRSETGGGQGRRDCLSGKERRRCHERESDIQSPR